VTRHPLAGFLSVEASARRIRRYRYVEERLMRILAGWIALTPELAAKLVLGRHVWDCAQHADLWGKRLLELRSPAQQSEPPGPEFVRLVDEVERPDAFHETPERLAGVYRVLKPCLVAAYERHLRESNPVFEPPTRRILERCLDEERRHIGAGLTVLGHLARTPERLARVDRRVAELTALLETTAGIAGDGSIAPADPDAMRSVPNLGQDLIELEKPAGGWPIPAELQVAVEAHGRAILAADIPAIERLWLPGAPAPSLEVALGLDAGPSAVSVVACARIGAYWMVKQRVATRAGWLVVQSRWVRVDQGWRIAECELVRREPAP
jgi:hypothetical protein